MSPQEAQTLGRYFAKQLEQEYQTTRKVLAAVPQDRLNVKLGEKGRTTAELAWHIVSGDRWFGRGVTEVDFSAWEPEGAPPPTAAEIVAQYEKDIPPLIERLKNMTGEQLAAPVNFMNRYTVPVVIVAGWWAHHSIHHRGQLSTYLRAMNARVPSIYGGSADELLEAASTA